MLASLTFFHWIEILITNHLLRWPGFIINLDPPESESLILASLAFLSGWRMPMNTIRHLLEASTLESAWSINTEDPSFWPASSSDLDLPKSESLMLASLAFLHWIKEISLTDNCCDSLDL
jgi:hypothetical protein